jgi:two-component system, OmpR family, response regulator
MRLLLAEDEDDLRQLFRLLLTTNGYEVVAVENGLAAVEEFAGGEFDGVILDLGMPEVSGRAAARLIRLVERFRSAAPVRIAFLTGYDRSPELILAQGVVGATRFWLKPVEPKPFLEDAAAWLSENP